MDKVIYLSMVAADQMMSAQNIHANNLANASTTGFRADLQSITNEPISAKGIPTFADKPVTKESYTDFTSGTMITTGRDLDLAISDKGWFAVLASDGTEAYTRAGDFTMSDTGELSTAGGHPVLGDGGNTFLLNDVESINVATDGTISYSFFAGTKKIPVSPGKLKLVNPPLTNLFKGKDGLFRTKDKSVLESDPSVKVTQGAYESSNVNIVSELVSMMQMSRSFELQLKLMKEADQNNGQAVSLMNLNG